MTTTQDIQEAINRSIMHNEIVHITIDGDSGDALAAIAELIEENLDYDYTMCDYEGVDTMDVWGFDEAAAEGEMVWRLAIRFGCDE